MKKIFVMSPYSSDPNSFWRCMGPMAYLAKHSGYQLYCAPQGVPFNWDTLAQYDYVFLHRPCRQEDFALIQMARQLNIPTWADYDDWLFHLPPWNPSAPVYHNLNLQQHMAACIASADVVSVTTGALSKMLMKLNPNVVIVPNAYRTDLFGFRKEPGPREDFLYWRGSNTHDGDVASVLDALPDLPGKTKFIGSPGYFALSKMSADKYEMINPAGNLHYWRMIYEMRGKVMILPLDDCFFNQCKSNIAWMEAVHAGSMIVVPDMPEWHQPGAIGYKPKDAHSFLEAVNYAFHLSESELTGMNKEAFSYMKQKFGIETVNKIREGILTMLTSPSFERNQKDPFLPGFGMWALNKLKEEASSLGDAQ